MWSRVIEQKVLESSEIESLEEPDDDESMELRERRSVGVVQVARTLCPTDAA